MRTRHYGTNEAPSVGDVVEIFEGPYGAGIVTLLDGDWAELERVHCFVSVTPSDRTRGQLQMGVERVRVEASRLRDMRVFTDGGVKPCNRAR